MKSLSIIMEGLGGIASTIFGNSNNNDQNQALQNQNLQLLQALHSQQRNNMPLYLAFGVVVIILIIKK